MKKTKLGIYIPGIPDNHQQATLAAIPQVIQEELLLRLRTLPNLELYDNLDFADFHCIDGLIYSKEKCLNELDGYIWYCDLLNRAPGCYELQMLKTLNLNVPVLVNPYQFEIGLDKYQSHLLLKNAGVNVAEFILVNHKTHKQCKALMDEWGVAVLKPRWGSFGNGVTFIDNFQQLNDIIEYIYATSGRDPDNGYFIERFYPNNHDDWAGVTMIHGEIIYGYHKRLSTLSYDVAGRHKVHDPMCIGGEVDLYSLNEKQKNEAKKAYHALGLEIVGFDMITHNGIPIIVDENTFPGYYSDLFTQIKKNPTEDLYQLICQKFLLN